MAYEMKPGQGSAFRNEDKREEWMADYRGKVMLPDGSMAFIDLTRKKTQKGDVYVAVRIKPMQARDAQTSGERSYDPPGKAPVPNDDIPF